MTPGADAGVRLSNEAGEEVLIGVSASPLSLVVDRRRSRATAFHKAYPERHSGPVRAIDGLVALRVLVDRWMVEVFANDGETVISDRLFPTQPLDRLEVLPHAGPPPVAKMWTLGSVWTRP